VRPHAKLWSNSEVRVGNSPTTYFSGEDSLASNKADVFLL